LNVEFVRDESQLVWFPRETTKSTLFRRESRCSLGHFNRMICDHLNASGRYVELGTHFATAFAYLRAAVAGNFRVGKTVLVPDAAWATVVQTPGRAAASAGFEYHARFADVHLCLEGRERIGWSDCVEGRPVRSAFDAEKDAGLYEGTPEDFVSLSGGRFAIFFPGELHAPLIGEGSLTKICVKVRCDSHPL
jgi:biofilm protein TabA